jgi:aryl-alcohol dehydrogenase-like predicted oxidoreductase
MDYIKFGNTGMDVSKVCLGTMGFGDPENWIHKWVLKEEKSREIIKKAISSGINFYDTANIYSKGMSEEILGRALKDYGKRDELVVSTKVFFDMKKGPNSGGLSRKSIMTEIDQSLKRLDMDYVDLYIIHRWDYNTPIEETMEALHDVVKSGKARYIGASAMFAWQFQKALHTAEMHSWTKFVSMQNHMNLIYREEEREMLPLCKDAKIAITPYSPLAAGRLVRAIDEKTVRSETDQIALQKYAKMEGADQGIIERVAELADKYETKKVNIALAWLMGKEGVTAPIIGATKLSHIDDAIASMQIKLKTEDIDYLEQLYVPHPVVGPV